MGGPDGYHDIWYILGADAAGIGITYIFTKTYENLKIEVSFSANKNMKLFTLRWNMN